MREKTIEQYLVDTVESRGGKCLKLTSPGNAGVPDRLIILQGEVRFLELKRPGETPSKLQWFWINLFQSFGLKAGFANTHAGVVEFLR